MTEPLAPYAARAGDSRGRAHPEPAAESRDAYQRDCDRITHAAAFRCLEYKTQVMVNHADGYFRTRLTHTMEVARLSRTLARALRLNEDLAEAVALAHDLGHTPFGHVGQDILNRCMREHGGFEHNIQSLRVVDELEEKYAAFPGLNLCFETREGLLKRCPRELARQLGAVGERFLQDRRPSLEAQLVDVADRIAYTNHDLDDGLKLGFLDLGDVRALALYGEAYDAVQGEHGAQARHVLQHEANRRMINRMMLDLIDATRARLAEHAPASAEDVRACPERLAGFSADLRSLLAPVTRFLHERYYHHPVLVENRTRAVDSITQLFGVLMECPELLADPLALGRVREKERRRGMAGRARGIADYLAGLSDRSILRECARLLREVGKFKPGDAS